MRKYMRKYISTVMAGVMLCAFSVVLSGCTEESGVKEQTKITAPDGSSTKQTNEIKIEKKGENPPLAPAEKK